MSDLESLFKVSQKKLLDSGAADFFVGDVNVGSLTAHVMDDTPEYPGHNPDTNVTLIGTTLIEGELDIQFLVVGRRVDGSSSWFIPNNDIPNGLAWVANSLASMLERSK